MLGRLLHPRVRDVLPLSDLVGTESNTSRLLTGAEMAAAPT